MPPNNTQQNTQPVDQQALALTHSIALAETGQGGKPDYNASGASGEKGAYQWMPGNFEADAKSAGLDPNDFSSENQDKVAYAQIKQYKDKGYDPGQIASLWNSGSPNNWQDHSGVNKEGVTYDTPAYVKKVQQNYQKLSGQNSSNQNSQGYNPTPYSNPTGDTSNPGLIDTSGNTPTSTLDTSLGGELNNRLTDTGAGLSKAVSGIGGILTGNFVQGGENTFNGLLQSAGSLAGGIGDVVNKGIELIPGVKAIESVIGSGIGKLAQTAPGQAIVKSLQDFGNSHPEITKDLGAGFNIVTALPILDGLGALKDAALDSASSLLKNKAETTFEKEATDVMGKTATGSEFVRNNPTVAKDMIVERLHPSIDGTNYDITDAMNKSESTIKDLSTQVKNTLKNQTTSRVANENETILNNVINGYTDRNGNVVEGFSNSNFTPQDILDNAKKLTPENGKLWDKFEKGDATIADINKLRSDLDSKVQSVYVSTNEPPIKKEMGANLAGSMRDFIQTTVPETQDAFSRMSKIYKIQDGLSYMSNKPVKSGLVGGFIQGATKGVPIVEGVGNKIASKLAGTTTGILDRSAPNAVRLSANELNKKLGGLFGGAVTQKLNQGR